MTRIVYPITDALEIVVGRGVGGSAVVAELWRPGARVNTALDSQASSPHAAAMAIARWVSTERDRVGLVGLPRADALAALAARLRGLAAAPHAERLRAAQVAARALGCVLRGPGREQRAHPARVAERWLAAVERVEAVARRFAERRVLLGPIGRPGMAYELILADPPWSYRDQGSRAAPGYAGDGRAAAVYEPMDDADVRALGVDLVPRLAPIALLALWVPMPILVGEPERYHAICEAWGFRRAVTAVPWIKTTRDGVTPRTGMGHYGRGCAEAIALATRGDVELVDSGHYLCLAPRGAATSLVADRGAVNLLCGPTARSVHSAKPEAQYAHLEALFAAATARLELFARARRPGWDAWGDDPVARAPAPPRCRCGRPLTKRRRRIDGRAFLECERRSTEAGHDAIETAESAGLRIVGEEGESGE